MAGCHSSPPPGPSNNEFNEFNGAASCPWKSRGNLAIQPVSLGQGQGFDEFNEFNEFRQPAARAIKFIKFINAWPWRRAGAAASH